MKKSFNVRQTTLLKVCSAKTLRIMKLTNLFLLVAVLNVFGSKTYSQYTKLDLDINDFPIKSILSSIEEQSEFFFLYSSKMIDVNQKASIHADNKIITQVLDELLAKTDIEYTIRDRQILLHNKEAKAAINMQQRQITGKVTSSANEPLAGVTIIVTGTAIGVLSDMNGNFSLSIPSDAKTLSFSFVGMVPQQVEIGDQRVFNIIMEESAIGLDEVVVVGYGTQKKVNLTGAVGTASSERLEARPIANVGRGLQGVVPNLNISFVDGDPANQAQYNVRGYTSITGGQPLVLVDGVPMNLEAINPNDISSVSVLKDASSAAIYGARAAFGVILVETKKGRTGKMNVNFGTELAMAKPIFPIVPVDNSYDYVTWRNLARIRDTGSPQFDDNMVEGTKKYYENPIPENEWGVYDGKLRYYGYNDYQKKLITDWAPQQTYDLSVAGGSENTNYYVSFGHMSKDGYLKMSDKNESFKRYNVLAKSDFKIYEWLTLNSQITTNIQVSDKPHFYNWDNNINTSARVPPIMPLKFPDLPYYITPGDRDKFAPYIGMWIGGKNPDGYFSDINFMPYLDLGSRETYNEYELWLSQGLTVTPFKGLSIKGDFSYKFYQRNYQDVASKIEVVSTNLSLYPNMISNGQSSRDFIKNRDDFNTYYVINLYGEYATKIGDHNLKSIIGFNQELGRNSYIYAEANNLLYPSIWDLRATSGTQKTNGSKSRYALRGAFGRLNYDYKEKYLIELNGRYDGTSRFPKDSRFGFFPSVSLAWRISNEPFMAVTSNWLDNLKLRGSYGELGNQALGGNDTPILQQNWGGYRTFTSGGNFYPYISTMGSGLGNYLQNRSAQEPYVSPGGLISSTLTWETVRSYNIGLDFTMLKEKLDFSGDIYRRETLGMLQRSVYPHALGTQAPNANAADLRTEGWEVSLTWRDDIGSNWNYRINIALADNQSEITKYDNPKGSLSSRYVGQQIGEIWGYKVEGLFQSEEEVAGHADQSAIGSNWKPGDIKIADLNGDNKINQGANTLSDPGDRTIVGNDSPRYTFGINSDISYKNFALNFFFQGVGKRDYKPNNNQGNISWYPGRNESVLDYYLTETWTPDRRDGYFPGASTSSKNFNPCFDRWIQNAAYIRLKNVTLNYSLPQNVINRIGFMQSLQVFVSGMNLFEISPIHHGLDPEVVTHVQRYFMQRIFTLGIKVGI